MKTLKQLLTVTFAIFMLTNTIILNAQTSLDENTVFMKTVMKESQKINNEISSYTYHSRYFEKIDATITITLNQNGKITSINDPSNTFSDKFLTDVINKSNSAASSGCSCVWYDLVCKAFCAICEGLGGNDCSWEK